MARIAFTRFELYNLLQSDLAIDAPSLTKNDVPRLAYVNAPSLTEDDAPLLADVDAPSLTETDASYTPTLAKTNASKATSNTLEAQEISH
uniref:Uncharacterized protein n=1 Tax=Lupinus angustifolius TaxID=3871 RepID=L0P0Z6_LUPAN|nr:hypothetical protein [Lupinus angustifolius]